jgi:rhodanese-related sulfurtransferase
MQTKTQNSFFKTLWQAPAILAVTAILSLVFNSARTGGIALIGDWSVDARMTTLTGERLDISLQEAQDLFHGQPVVFLDARSADDYARGHIQGARSLPWQNVDQIFMAVTEDLDPQTPIVTYCDGETCSLSHDLAVFLKDMGFMNVRLLVNGWTVWQAAGLPVEFLEINDDDGTPSQKNP